jgi:hypothetical protein
MFWYNYLKSTIRENSYQSTNPWSDTCIISLYYSVEKKSHQIQLIYSVYSNTEYFYKHQFKMYAAAKFVFVVLLILNNKRKIVGWPVIAQYNRLNIKTYVSSVMQNKCRVLRNIMILPRIYRTDCILKWKEIKIKITTLSEQFQNLIGNWKK